MKSQVEPDVESFVEPFIELQGLESPVLGPTGRVRRDNETGTFRFTREGPGVTGVSGVRGGSGVRFEELRGWVVRAAQMV